MKKKKIVFFLIFLVLISVFIIHKLYKKKLKIDEKTSLIKDVSEDDLSYSSNIINNVNYSSKGMRGNEYNINALKGEIDYQNDNIIYLTDVNAIIELKGSEKVKIKSKYGKYNIDNFDTIFSKKVQINYLNKKITGDYLDFSIKKNLLIISRNVIYTNLESSLFADVFELNIETNDAKIYMYEKNKDVRIINNN
jgi:LPS export ABC transporter protein LptC